MALLVSGLGAFIAAVGLFGVADPGRLLKLVERFRGATGVWVAAGVRLVLGVVFLLAAADCRLPTFVMTVGIIALLAAVGLPIMGQRRFDAMVAWLVRRPQVVIRLWAVAAVAFGGLLVYAGGWPS